LTVLSLITDYTSIVSEVQDILQNVELQTPTEDFYEDVESIQEQIPADFHEEVKSKPLLYNGKCPKKTVP